MTTRVKVLLVLATLGVGIVTTQSASAGCTTTYAPQLASGHHTVATAVAFERCAV